MNACVGIKSESFRAEARKADRGSLCTLVSSPHHAARKVRIGCRPRIEAVAFWLLLVAWGCANNPQAAVVATITWIQETHHRSGHRNLNLAVAQLLSAEQKVAEVAAEAHDAEKPPLPTVPATLTLKKLALGLEPTGVVLMPRSVACGLGFADLLTHAAREYPPLLEPPRRTG
jgi:hypothetical protein